MAEKSPLSQQQDVEASICSWHSSEEQEYSTTPSSSSQSHLPILSDHRGISQVLPDAIQEGLQHAIFISSSGASTLDLDTVAPPIQVEQQVDVVTMESYEQDSEPLDSEGESEVNNDLGEQIPDEEVAVGAMEVTVWSTEDQETPPMETEDMINQSSTSISHGGSSDEEESDSERAQYQEGGSHVPVPPANETAPSPTEQEVQGKEPSTVMATTVTAEDKAVAERESGEDVSAESEGIGSGPEDASGTNRQEGILIEAHWEGGSECPGEGMEGGSSNEDSLLAVCEDTCLEEAGDSIQEGLSEEVEGDAVNTEESLPTVSEEDSGGDTSMEPPSEEVGEDSSQGTLLSSEQSGEAEVAGETSPPAARNKTLHTKVRIIPRRNDAALEAFSPEEVEDAAKKKKGRRKKRAVIIPRERDAALETFSQEEVGVATRPLPHPASPLESVQSEQPAEDSYQSSKPLFSSNEGAEQGGLSPGNPLPVQPSPALDVAEPLSTDDSFLHDSGHEACLDTEMMLASPNHSQEERGRARVTRPVSPSAPPARKALVPAPPADQSSSTAVPAPPTGKTAPPTTRSSRPPAQPTKKSPIAAPPTRLTVRSPPSRPPAKPTKESTVRAQPTTRPPPAQPTTVQAPPTSRPPPAQPTTVPAPPTSHPPPAQPTTVQAPPPAVQPRSVPAPPTRPLDSPTTAITTSTATRMPDWNTVSASPAFDPTPPMFTPTPLPSVPTFVTNPEELKGLARSAAWTRARAKPSVRKSRPGEVKFMVQTSLGSQGTGSEGGVWSGGPEKRPRSGGSHVNKSGGSDMEGVRPGGLSGGSVRGERSGGSHKKATRSGDSRQEVVRSRSSCEESRIEPRPVHKEDTRPGGARKEDRRPRQQEGAREEEDTRLGGSGVLPGGESGSLEESVVSSGLVSEESGDIDARRPEHGRDMGVPMETVYVTRQEADGKIRVQIVQRPVPQREATNFSEDTSFSENVGFSEDGEDADVSSSEDKLGDEDTSSVDTSSVDILGKQLSEDESLGMPQAHGMDSRQEGRAALEGAKGRVERGTRSVGAKERPEGHRELVGRGEGPRWCEGRGTPPEGREERGTAPERPKERGTAPERPRGLVDRGTTSRDTMPEEGEKEQDSSMEEVDLEGTLIVDVEGSQSPSWGSVTAGSNPPPGEITAPAADTVTIPQCSPIQG